MQRSPDLPRDFELRLVWVGDRGVEDLCEVFLELDRDNVGRLRIRRSDGPSDWLHLFDRSFETVLAHEKLVMLSKELQSCGFTELPTTLIDPANPAARKLVLRVSQWGSTHQVHVVGRPQAALVKAIAAIDRILPIDLAPWPMWMTPEEPSPKPRPHLRQDLDAALLFHERWIAEKPRRGELHLDRYLLLIKAGRLDDARAELEEIRKFRVLAGLIPELEKLLR